MNSDGSIVEETTYGNTSLEAESFASFAEANIKGKERYEHELVRDYYEKQKQQYT